MSKRPSVDADWAEELVAAANAIRLTSRSGDHDPRSEMSDGAAKALGELAIKIVGALINRHKARTRSLATDGWDAFWTIVADGLRKLIQPLPILPIPAPQMPPKPPEIP